MRMMLMETVNSKGGAPPYPLAPPPQAEAASPFQGRCSGRGEQVQEQAANSLAPPMQPVHTMHDAVCHKHNVL
jgi:hypothetical protein